MWLYRSSTSEYCKRLKILFFISSLLIFLLAGNIYAESISGYHYIKPDTRAMQDDDFVNPGLFAVERGQELFNQKQGQNQQSCASCHGEAGEKLEVKKISQFPVYNSDTKEIITLQKRIQRCGSRITSQSIATDHPDLIALETFVRNLAHGEKVNVKTDGPVVTVLKKGENCLKHVMA